jgi:hypothetical protein
MARLFQNLHAVPGKEILEEPDNRCIPSLFITTLPSNHNPVSLLFIRNWLIQGLAESLLVIEPYSLVGTKQMLSDLCGKALTVCGIKILYLCLKISFHPLNISRGVVEYKAGYLFTQFAACFCLHEFPALPSHKGIW